MNRFDEELVCADSLAHHLKSYCGCSEVKTRREKNDPPDFWFDIDSQEYAAEVTSIVSDQGYHAACTALKDSVKKSVIADGSIAGSYCLKISQRPNLPRRHSTEWRDLCDKAICIIRNADSKGSSKETFLLEEKEGKLSILKIDTNGTSVGLLWMPESKWEGEVHNELQGLIQDAVTTKRKKLETKKVPEQCPRILLVLYDAYGYGDIEEAQKALLSTSGYDWFHSVFWATSFTDRKNIFHPDSPGRVGTFLYSKTDKWLSGNL